MLYKHNEERNAFDILKCKPVSARSLKFADPTLPYEVATDVSCIGIGAKLTQTDKKNYQYHNLPKSLTKQNRTTLQEKGNY